MTPKNAVVFLVLVCVLLVAFPALSVQTVTNPNNSGAGSLRQAITDAASGEEIVFSMALPSVISLSSSLTVDKHLTITGPGADLLTVSGNLAVRVFLIVAGNVTISGLSIQHGRLNGGGAGFRVETSAQLNLSRSVVMNCEASSAYGGGIFIGDFATVHLTDATISGNTATNGGGIYSLGWGNLELTRTTVFGNHATWGGSGGGINSTGGSLAMSNSTISGNDAQGSGGGIVANLMSVFSVDHCTIADNTSLAGGGGLHLLNTIAILQNTILAGNIGGDGNNFFNAGGGSLISAGYNLADDAPAGLNGTGDQINASAGLAALADNGGETQTHALMVSSDAIDQIPSGTNGCQPGVSVDQRTYPRAGGGGSGGSACDVGAFEYDTIPVELMSYSVE